LIAEPWDVGEGGYQVGNFPPLWLEWNGRYRDTVRAYWRGEDGLLGRFASRLVGSADLYADSGRRPFASVNFVTAHDGFTLRDLVSYDVKHNEANGEANRDGESHNLSWNCGAEGPIDDSGVNALRARQQRNFLATLFLSQGIPMLLAGDEIGRTQHGNNNGYCQDNELSWIDWQGADLGLLAFVQRLIALRRAHPVLRRRRWLVGATAAGTVHDVDWFRPDGAPMSEEDWNTSFAKAIGVFFNGEAIPSRDVRGERITDDCFLILMNAHTEGMNFTLPATQWGKRWETLLDTALEPGLPHQPLALRQPERMQVSGHSLVLLRRVE
jgi:glycogen operon protein